jgi:maleylacetate reductase
MAEEAVRVVIAALSDIRDNRLQYNDASACRDLLYGSHLCGAALNACAMGVHHKLAHVLGGQFGLPHAKLHTVLLPHSVGFNRIAAPNAMAALCRAIGVFC